MTSCPDTDVLEQRLSGNLAGPLAAGVDEHVQACPRCQAWLADRTEHADLRRFANRALTLPSHEEALEQMLQRLRGLPRRGTDADTPPAADGLRTTAPPGHACDPGTLGAYRIEAEIGRGGMGIVYRAFDEVLKRFVAVKMLRPELDDSSARARLVREAQLAARFRHEHVVAVHAVVDLPGSPPYLVMEYVPGKTLKAVVRSTDGLPLAEAVQLVAQVADGLAAAHAAGLIHRDVKPGNVLIDPATGKARLTDFGLARMVADEAGLTRPGAITGTPEYMSPEQVRDPARIDERSDVYSLGVTLYECLTGEAPFRGVPHMILERLLNEEPVPPRRLNDKIPRDLETICLKAMAREPHRRYQSARDFADDLRRWQRNEPVRARRVGLVGHASRWCRRRPLAAGLAAALVLVGLLGVAGVVWQWRRAEAKADLARLKAVEARRDFDRARDVVDRYLTDVSEDPDLKARNLEPLRRRLLLTARDYYEAFVREHPDEPDLQAELGRAHGRLGVIAAILDSPPASIALFEKKRAIFERLCRQQPGDASYRNELADSYWRLGYGHHYADHKEAAWEAFRQARLLWEGLARDFPDEPEYAARLIRTLNSLGRSYHILLRYREAEQTLLDGQAAYERWQRTGNPDEARCRESGAWVLANLGSLYRFTGRPGDGCRPLERAVALADRLVAAAPRDVGRRTLLHHCWHELGAVHFDLAQASQTEAAFVRARTVAEELVRDHPGDAEQAAAVAQSSDYLGRTRYELQVRPVEALRDYEQARAILDWLVVEYPDVLPHRRICFGLYLHQTELLRETGRLKEALRLSSAAIARCEAARKRNPSDEELRGEQGCYYAHRAETLIKLRRCAEARKDCDQAVALASVASLRRDAEQLRTLVEGHALAEQGQYHQAASSAEAIARGPAGDGRMLYLAAVLLARCVTVDPDFAVRSLALLRQAETAGYLRLPSRRALLESDGDLAPLRPRADYQEFLRQLRQSPAVKVISRSLSHPPPHR